jgi:hypothetical protein
MDRKSKCTPGADRLRFALIYAPKVTKRLFQQRPVNQRVARISTMKQIMRR